MWQLCSKMGFQASGRTRTKYSWLMLMGGRLGLHDARRTSPEGTPDQSRPTVRRVRIGKTFMFKPHNTAHRMHTHARLRTTNKACTANRGNARASFVPFKRNTCKSKLRRFCSSAEEEHEEKQLHPGRASSQRRCAALHTM